MGKLDEFRKLFQSPEEAEREGDAPDLLPLEKHEQEAKQRGEKYVIISVPGRPDARLLFGKYSGEKVSRMTMDEEGTRYLKWIVENDFPQELKTICAHWLSRPLWPVTVREVRS